MAVQIDVGTFSARLKKLYDSWQAGGDVWAGSTALAIAVGPATDELRYLKSITLHLYLFGYELPDTILGFTRTALHVVTSSKKAAMLQSLVEPAKENLDVTLHIHVKQKGQDGGEQIAALLDGIKASGEPCTLGVISKEKPEGALMDQWGRLLSDSGLETADISAGLAHVFAVKDPAEQLAVKKAAHLAASCWKNFAVPELEGTQLALPEPSS